MNKAEKKSETYYTRASTAEDAYELRQAHDPWAVCEQMENGKDRVLAYCPTLTDAERVKALLVYYGERLDRATRTSVIPH